MHDILNYPNAVQGIQERREVQKRAGSSSYNGYSGYLGNKLINYRYNYGGNYHKDRSHSRSDSGNYYGDSSVSRNDKGKHYGYGRRYYGDSGNRYNYGRKYQLGNRYIYGRNYDRYNYNNYRKGKHIIALSATCMRHE